MVCQQEITNTGRNKPSTENIYPTHCKITDFQDIKNCTPNMFVSLFVIPPDHHILFIIVANLNTY